MNRDLALTELVAYVNGGGERIPVVLLIGGAIVTGILTNAREYANAHPTVPIRQPSADLDDLLTAHLADATVNGQALGWWRFQIDRVDAFSLQSVA